MGSFKVFKLLLLGVLFWASAQYLPRKEAKDMLPSLSDSLVRETTKKPRAKNFKSFETHCQYSTVKGRRLYQEDRVRCNMHLQIPIHGKNVKVGLVAVFDGHFGAEASKMVSSLFLTDFLLNTFHLGNPSDETLGSVEDSYMVTDEPNHTEILKDALLQTIKGVEDAFLQEALKHDLAAGTTAVVVLLVDNQILAANIGDSKALLCTKDAREDGSLHLSPKELTRDHTALIHEERARIEAAGGTIVYRKVPLVNGHFPMTRAIGDIPMKKYGIISEPEVTGWIPVTDNDSYLVVSSDGIFDNSLTLKDVCNLLEGNGGREGDGINPSAAEIITQTAYDKGSPDNLSVVVVPLT